MQRANSLGWGGTALVATALVVALYFSLSAIQGDFGLFRQVSAETRLEALRAERDALAQEVELLESRTKRLSDNYLDLDLLDQQLRERLGFLRSDEVVLR